MTKSPRIPITVTPERQQALDAIWERVPHLKGSVTATFDHLCSIYLDPSKTQPQPTSEKQTDSKPDESEPTTIAPAIDDEW
ncbi:MAG: hypothetical protein KME43_11365 [Myxacorys chilensis ATA2-1-KO14]|jgi:hypothetical protein|nr:hypothetical protein [Myxacorys chilensis ATA2-1-KO14]